MRLGVSRLFLAFCLCSGLGSAAPVLWIVSGTFNDGGTASGSFIYDADTNVYSAINVTTTTGSTRSGALYTVQNGGNANGLGMVTIVAPNLTGTPWFHFSFSTLTNAGGTRSVNGQEVTCAAPACGSGVGPTRNFTGTIQSSAPPVPLPPTMVLTLIAMALIGLDQARRRFRTGTVGILRYAPSISSSADGTWRYKVCQRRLRWRGPGHPLR